MKGIFSSPRRWPRRATTLLRTARVRRFGWWMFGIVAAIGVLGSLLAPPIVRSQLEQQLTGALHRKVTIDSVRINPYVLTVTVRGLRVNERNSGERAFAVDELYVDVSPTSLYRRAPVLTAVRVTKPQVQIVRLAGNRYNWSDLVDEFLNKPKDPNDPPARFAVANIELADGGVDFDDRPEGIKHALSAIQLAIPFLSSLPVHQEINVEPKFSARFDDSPLELAGKAKPFKESRDSTLRLDLDGLDLTRFLKYVPDELPVKVISARLEADIDITFAQPKGRAPSIVLSGTTALRDLEVQELSGAALLKLPQVGLALRAVEPLQRRLDIAKVTIEAPDMRVHRRKNGEFFLMRLLTPRTDTRQAPSVEPPLSYKIDEIALTAGKVDMLDERGARPVRMKFDEVRVAVQGLSSEPAASGRFDVFLHAASDDALAMTGTFGLQPLQAEGTLKLERARLVTFWPYVEQILAFDIADGELDVTTAFRYTADGAPNVVLKDLEVALRSLNLRQRWDKQEFLRMPSLSARAVEFDLHGQTVKIGELASSGGRIQVDRDRSGTLNLEKLLAVNSAGRKADLPVAARAAEKPWVIMVQKLAVERYAATIKDESAGPAATVDVGNLALTASNLATVKGQRGNVALKLTLNKTGTLAVNGPLAITPLSARLRIDARNVGIVPVQPYFERFINAIVSSGEITAQGDAVFDLPDAGTARGGFKGDVTLTNFAAVTQAGNEDLLRWKSLSMMGVDTTIEPLKVTIGEIALADFYSRLVINADGRINLQELYAGKDAPAAVEGAQPAVAQPAIAQSQAAVTSTPPGGATSAVPDVQIGKITLADGNVNFSDLFIKPNYSANLTGVGGSVSTIARDVAGDVDVRARIDNTAPVEITGKINPLAKELFLDLKSRARDIELAPLTPYAHKYVGYGIEKGKLSMNVSYRVENRKLTAQNNVILNQLTFGGKVESPTATKLPVLFAVSLLTDRNGVIDINLPVSGSLDDPQFSVGGIILRVIVNLLVKVVTSPFALIGSIFGGGEELAYVEFAPGSTALTSTAADKISNVAKALTDRPALKLDVTGRVDPTTDREGLRKTSLERKVKAQKLKDTVKGGVAGALDQVTVDAGEYAKYLARAYENEKFPKPRNVIGLAKGLPVAEMEQLMIKNAQVTDDDLRQLASGRAQKVKDALVDTSSIPAERVFLLAPKLSAEGIKDKGDPMRVDFSLK